MRGPAAAAMGRGGSSGKRWQQRVAAAAPAINGNHQRRRTLDDAAVQWKEKRRCGGRKAVRGKATGGRDATLSPSHHANAPPRNC